MITGFLAGLFTRFVVGVLWTGLKWLLRRGYRTVTFPLRFLR